MRPLAALLGIFMGSAVAIFVGLTLTYVVFLLLPEYHKELGGEFRPLLQAIAWTALLAAASAAAFLGEIRQRPWRYAAQVAVVLALVGVAWRYLPA
jgi:heme/copper-type cytochrome/quinol oxidase subunit 3